MSRLFCISKCIQQRVKISLCSLLYVTENLTVRPKVFLRYLVCDCGRLNKLTTLKMGPHYTL